MMLRMRRHGFTLLELIVSIAIIGVLLALIAPSLSKVRESTRIQRDVSTVRSIGAASLIWATDHKDFWPHIVDAPRRLYNIHRCSDASSSLDWFSQTNLWTIPLHGYMDHSEMVSAFHPENTGYQGLGLTQEQIADLQTSANSGCSGTGIAMSSALITNWALWKLEDPIVDKNQLRPVQVAEVAHPSNKVMFSQGIPYYLPGFDAGLYHDAAIAGGLSNSGVSFGVPIVRIDGSASAIELKNFPVSIPNPFFADVPSPFPAGGRPPVFNTRDGFLGRDFN